MIAICGSAFLAGLNLKNARAISYSMIISEDTTWTRANGSYDLDGNVLVSKNATLTVEPGVRINCDKNIIQVDGTLKVLGNDQNNVVFISTNAQIDESRSQNANINFGDESTGNVIQYAIFRTMAWTFFNCADTITIDHVTIEKGSAPTYNGYGFVTALAIIRGSGKAIITNSAFTNPLQICISSTVINNTFSITNDIMIYSAIEALNGEFVITNNIITGTGISASDGEFLITNNIITGTKSGWGYGILIGGYQKAVIADNYIVDFPEACIKLGNGPALIQRNYLESLPNQAGYPFFGIEVEACRPLIQNNTIKLTGTAICLHDNGYVQSKPTIRNNNIYKNRVSNIFLGYPDLPGYNNSDYFARSNIDAANNWWGTTDAQTINQTIRDFKTRQDLGTVTYTPFLTELNPQAMPNPNASAATLELNPATTAIQATNEDGKTIDLTVDGNLTIDWPPKAKVTADPATYSTNVTFLVQGWFDRDLEDCNITIPKSAIPYGNTPTVYFKQLPAEDLGYTQDVDNYYVWCTTHLDINFRGPLTIVFSGTSFPLTIIAIGAIITLALATATFFIWRRKRKKKQLLSETGKLLCVRFLNLALRTCARKLI